MRIPGPTALISAASSIREEVTDLVLDIPGTVGEVLDLIARAGEMLDRVDGLLTRAEDLLDRGEGAVTGAEAMLASGETLLARADATITGAEQTAAAAALTVIDVQQVTQSAARTAEAAALTAGGADDLVRRGDTLMRPWEPIAEKVVPLARGFVDTVRPEEVAALAGIVDKLPQLLTALEDDVLPMLGKLDQVGPDVHEILETVHEMTRALAGLPGAGFLKRRGERKEEEHDSPGGPGVPRI